MISRLPSFSFSTSSANWYEFSEEGCFDSIKELLEVLLFPLFRADVGDRVFVKTAWAAAMETATALWAGKRSVSEIISGDGNIPKESSVASSPTCISVVPMEGASDALKNLIRYLYHAVRYRNIDGLQGILNNGVSVSSKMFPISVSDSYPHNYAKIRTQARYITNLDRL